MDFRERYKSRVGTYAYPTSCIYGGSPRYTSLEYTREEVTSYRGKPQFIEVAGGKRKRFQPFTRWRRWHTMPANGLYCPDSGVHQWGEDIPVVNCQYFADNEGLAASSGSDWPLISKARCMALGEQRREMSIRDAYVKLKEPKFNAAMSLADLDGTLKGILDLFKGCVKAFVKGTAKSKNQYQLKQLVHYALNSEELWLWYRYALMPTILEVNDLIQAIKPQKKVRKFQAGNKIKSEVQTGKILHHGWSRSSPSTWEYPWRTTYSVRTGAALEVHCMFDPSPWGTSLQDVLVAGWDQIPFSFILNWFVDVESFLMLLRDVEANYIQSYASYAVSATTKFLPSERLQFTGNCEVHTFMMDRIIDIEPEWHPLVDARWANCTRVIDLISLTIGILKGLLSPAIGRKTKRKK